jgi:cytoskeletal protein RodZ
LRGGRFSQTLGQYLKREREARDVSLEELSHGTRINRPFLEALERDDFNFFSQKEFVLGFLKRYARFLSLDEQDVLRRFIIQTELVSRNEKFEQVPLFGETLPPAKTAGAGEGKKEVPRKTGAKRHRGVWLQIIVLGTAISLTFYLNYLIKDRERLRERSQTEGGEKKEERVVDGKGAGAEGSKEEKPTDPKRLNPSDQGKKERVNKKGSESGRPGARRYDGG